MCVLFLEILLTYVREQVQLETIFTSEAARLTRMPLGPTPVLRLVIEHQGVCRLCWSKIKEFCEAKKYEAIVYRPTRPSRANSNGELVAGSTAMNSAWGGDITTQVIAHYPCDKYDFQQSSGGHDIFRCQCGRI
eukprot:COSAG01_NODE_5052_length_4523_cov_2.790009_6_plen_134_part_00